MKRWEIIERERRERASLIVVGLAELQPNVEVYVLGKGVGSDAEHTVLDEWGPHERPR